MTIRYTWSRGTHDPVEHIATNDEFSVPVCGATLNPGFQTYADKPSGLARLCPACPAKARAFRLVSTGLYRNLLTGIEIKNEIRGIGAGRFVGKWVVTEPVGDQRSWLTTTSYFAAARKAAVEVVERMITP